MNQSNFTQHIVNALSTDVDGSLSSTLINVCHYFAENYEDYFLSAGGVSGLIFSG